MTKTLDELLDDLETFAYESDFVTCEKIRAKIKEALAQPEQEPDDGYCKACDGWKCTAKAGCVALSNPPPQRTWVGLTDEDLIDCESEEDVQFVRRIEAKLKEKNI